MERHEINGLDVRIDDIGPRSGSVVLMSNSLAADLTMWDEQADELAKTHRVIRYDTRGHGGTSAPDGEYTLDLLVSDVVALIDRFEVEKVNFVGLSLGGLIGQLMALRVPERLESLVLCATFSSAPSEMWNDRAQIAREGGFDSLIEPTLERWLTRQFREANPKIEERVRQMIAGTSPIGYAGCACAIRDMDIDAIPEAIRIPTLVMAGVEDPSATLKGMIGLHRRIAGSKFAQIAGGAHLFTVECPEETTRILVEFLESIPGGDGAARTG